MGSILLHTRILCGYSNAMWKKDVNVSHAQCVRFGRSGFRWLCYIGA